MQTIYTVICDNGDNTQTVEWRKNWSDEILTKLENNRYEAYASGDGVQMTELKFPDSFDLDEFAMANYITWADGSENEE